MILWWKERKKEDGKGVFVRLMENMGELKVTWSLSFFYIFNGVCSISALNFISIPLYLAGRRCYVLFAVLVKVFLCQFKTITKSMVYASLIITASALVAI